MEKYSLETLEATSVLPSNIDSGNQNAYVRQYYDGIHGIPKKTEMSSP